MNQKEFFFNQSDTKLYGAYFKPENVKAVVVLIHGMGEYFGRYTDHVIPYFYKNSFAVITYDQFGHGKTEGKRGHNPGFEKVLDCVSFAINKSKEVFGKKSVFLYGHSMGGNVVINYVLRREHDLKGVIATSPFLKIAFEPPAWKLKIAKILLKIAPSLTMGNELDVNAVSRDKNEVDKYKKDPLIHDKVSPNYSIVFIESGQWAIDNAKKLNIPMLLMHGTGDQLTNYKGSQEFAKNADNKITLELFDDGYHELHNDIIKNKVLDTMLSWLNKEIQ